MLLGVSAWSAFDICTWCGADRGFDVGSDVDTHSSAGQGLDVGIYWAVGNVNESVRQGLANIFFLVLTMLTEVSTSVNKLTEIFMSVYKVLIDILMLVHKVLAP